MAISARGLLADTPKRNRTVELADLFCGAGGTTTGAKRALEGLGLRMRVVAVNHWDVAIETHKRNHPDAYHINSDISAVRPIIAVPKGKLDLLTASPTCTYHSRARGGKPIHDQQRADPWHIVTWLTELRVRCLLVENVPEFVDWSPVDPRTSRPVKSRRGEYFQAWVTTIKRLGYEVDWKILNAADYGDATTRRRFFLIARNDPKPLRWPEPTHAKHPEGTPLFGQPLRPWRAARSVIDWSLQGRSIFDRKKPLSPKTLARIYAGMLKFEWPEPFLVILRNHAAVQGLDLPLPTLTAGGTHIGLAQPFVFANRNNNVAKDPDTDPVPSICTRGNAAFVEPFLLPQETGRKAKSSDDPVPTVTTIPRIGLVEPFITAVAHGNDPKEKHPDHRRSHSIDEPLQTIHGSGRTYGIVEPFIVNRHGDNGSARVHSVDEPTPTATCRGAGYLVEPFVLSQASGGAPRSVDDPIPTIATDGAHAMIAPYYGSGSGATCSSVEHPVPTVTTKARFGLIMPITHAGTGNRARDIDTEPLPTVTGAHRGELGFIAASFGEREGQAPRVHSVDAPVPTICAQGRTVLVRPGRDFDILFRMLEPAELARAHSLDGYAFCGTKTDVTKQIGNSVPAELAAALIGALMAPLA